MRAAVVDLPQRFRFHQVAVGGVIEVRSEVGRHEEVAPHEPGLPHALRRHVECGWLDAATDGFQHAQPALAALDDAGLDGQVAVEVAEPTNASACRIVLQRLAGLRHVGELVEPARQRQRRPRVVTGLGPEQQRHVQHGAAHRPLGAELGQVAVTLRARRAHGPGSAGTRRRRSMPQGCAAIPCSRCHRPPAACAWPARRPRHHCCLLQCG